MASKAMTQPSDSENPVVSPAPRNERIYNLTSLGHQAVRWLKEQDAQQKPLPMDALPHRDIKKS